MSIFSRIFNKGQEQDEVAPSMEEGSPSKEDESKRQASEGIAAAQKALNSVPPPAEMASAGLASSGGPIDAPNHARMRPSAPPINLSPPPSHVTIPTAPPKPRDVSALGSAVPVAGKVAPSGTKRTAAESVNANSPETTPARSKVAAARPPAKPTKPAGAVVERTPGPGVTRSSPSAFQAAANRAAATPAPKLGFVTAANVAADHPVVPASEPPLSLDWNDEDVPLRTNSNAAQAQSPPGGIPHAASLEELFNDVEARFGDIVRSDSPAVPSRAHPTLGNRADDLKEVHELFGQLASNHMRQVRDFMIDLKAGEAERDWVAICEPATLSLKKAAEELELKGLSTALDGFNAKLTVAAHSENAILTGEIRDQLVSAYDKLLEVMPEAFAVDSERSRREAIIIRSLLLLVPGVRKLTIDKLYAAGLSTLDVIFLAKADDVAQTTGLPPDLAEKVVQKFQDYRRELHTTAKDATYGSERQRLGALVTDLRQTHLQFEAASAGWSEHATQEKKRLRRARADMLLQVKVVLARLGEVERVFEIERAPFQRKLEQIDAFLGQVKSQYAGKV